MAKETADGKRGSAPPGATAPARDGAREAKLAAALRANLRRRKAGAMAQGRDPPLNEGA